MTDHDDRSDADVRGWLADVPAPPPRLEVDRIVQAGRSAARRRRLLAAGGSAAAVLLALAAVPAAGQVWPDRTGAPAAAPGAASPGGTGPPDGSPAASPAAAADPLECRATVLAPPDGLAERGVVDPRAVRVVGMDPTGRYLVGETYGGRSNSPAAVRWDRGEPAVLPTGTGHVSPTDVSSRGDVVGWGARGTGPFYAWLYRHGEVTELPMPDGYRESEAVGINSAGDVVGSVQDGEYHSEVAVWPAAAPDQPRLLPAPAGEQVAPAAITDDGTVVGWLHGSTGGYAWGPDGTGRELPLPTGAREGTIADARGPWAVGFASFPASEAALDVRGNPPGTADATVPVPVRWDLRTGAVAELPGYQDPGRVSLNASGFGGDAVNPAGDMVVGYPEPQVLREDGRPVTLPAPVADDAWPDPVAISDDGTRVAGNVRADSWGSPGLDAPLGSGTGPKEPSDLPRPVVWDC